MADRPRLSAADRRTVRLKLEELDEQFGFVGNAHLGWTNSPYRREKARALRIRPVEDASPHGPLYVAGNEPIWGQAELDALLNDPMTIDQIGVEETVGWACGAFDAYAGVYFSSWDKTTEPYERFIAWLRPLKAQTIRFCRWAKWPHRGEWFNRMVPPYANDKLDAAIEDWRRRARAAELKRLTSQAAVEPLAPAVEVSAARAAMAAPAAVEAGSIAAGIEPPAASPAESASVAAVTNPSASNQAAPPRTAEPEPATGPSAAEPLTLGEWLQTEMERLEISSPYRIQQLGGPKQATTQRVLDNLPVRPSTVKRLVNAINRARADKKLPPIKAASIMLRYAASIK